MWFFLDPSNKIIDVSPDWDSLVLPSGGVAVQSHRVVGRSLWDFVNGGDTRSYLNALFFWCRQTGHALTMPYRCDAPNLRRECRMKITPHIEGGLEIRHDVLLIRETEGFHALEPDGTAEQCSQCLSWHGPAGWYDQTMSVPARDMFVHYVICPQCRLAARRALGGDPAGAGALPG